MMKRPPREIASVHCHSPHATAFAIAGVVPPTCLLPEYEVFCTVALAPYRTPGTPELGRLIADLVDTHDTILMANHGVVTWSHNNVEKAYWRLEVIESYCRTLLAAGQLGRPQLAIEATPPLAGGRVQVRLRGTGLQASSTWQGTRLEIAVADACVLQAGDRLDVRLQSTNW